MRGDCAPPPPVYLVDDDLLSGIFFPLSLCGIGQRRERRLYDLMDGKEDGDDGDDDEMVMRWSSSSL